MILKCPFCNSTLFSGYELTTGRNTPNIAPLTFGEYTCSKCKFEFKRKILEVEEIPEDRFFKSETVEIILEDDKHNPQPNLGQK